MLRIAANTIPYENFVERLEARVFTQQWRGGRAEGQQASFLFFPHPSNGDVPNAGRCGSLLFGHFSGAPLGDTLLACLEAGAEPPAGHLEPAHTMAAGPRRFTTHPPTSILVVICRLHVSLPLGADGRGCSTHRPLGQCVRFTTHPLSCGDFVRCTMRFSHICYCYTVHKLSGLLSWPLIWSSSVPRMSALGGCASLPSPSAAHWRALLRGSEETHCPAVSVGNDTWEAFVRHCIVVDVTPSEALLSRNLPRIAFMIDSGINSRPLPIRERTHAAGDAENSYPPVKTPIRRFESHYNAYGNCNTHMPIENE